MVLLLLFMPALIRADPLSNNSLTCTLCQFATNFIYNSTETGLKNVAELREQCRQLSDCHHAMTDCELVTHLSSFGFTEEQYKPFLFVTRLLAARCMFEPDSEVIEEFQLPIFLMGDVCKILYRQFSKINDGLHGKDITIAVNVLEGVCSLTAILIHPPPKMCEPIAVDGALEAIVRGIEDSLGPFYNEIGKIFGCPSYLE